MSPGAAAQPATPPVLGSFTPASGPAGTKVTLNGDNLGTVTAVKFNGIAAQFTVFNANQLIAVVPTGAASGGITVTGPGGTAASTDPFTVTASPPPHVTGFEPASGAAGTDVTIHGQNLAAATAVRFNGVESVFHEGFSGESLVATVPAGAASGPVTVVTPGGTATSSSSFTVTAVAAPVITSFSPASGSPGTSVVVSGNNLIDATAVRFGGVNATFTVFGSTVVATVPAGASTGPIAVITPGGTATSSTPFTVAVASAPSITGLSPNSGRPGTRVTISGANLDGVTAVRFNGVSAAFSEFGSSILATVPADATSGPVTVLNSQGSATSPSPFTVLSQSAPEITSFAPLAAPADTVLTIYGTNFVNVTDVLVSGVSSPFNAVSPSEIRTIIPNSATSGAVSVVTEAGTATSSDNLLITAAVFSFEPTLGKPGTAVTIRGLNFDGVIAVLFAGASASFTTVSSTEIRAIVPDDATTGSITVATPAGFGSSTNVFLLPPIIESFDPSGGLPGSTVKITGQNLLGTTEVRIGAVTVPSTVLSVTTVVITVPGDVQNGPITVVTPAGSTTSTNDFLVGFYTDVSLAASLSPETVSLGDFVRYTLNITNRGPAEAVNVVVIDKLPAGIKLLFAPSGADCTETNHVITCRLGTLARGLGASIGISGTVVAGPYLTNQVDVALAGGDLNPADNSSTMLTPVQGTTPPVGDMTLGASWTGKALVLSWDGSMTDAMLETASSLVPPVTWTPVSETPTSVNGRKTVSQSTTSGTRFYRLRRP